jgi:hypothetical protein
LDERWFVDGLPEVGEFGVNADVVRVVYVHFLASVSGS